MPLKDSSAERTSSAEAIALMGAVVSPLNASWKVPDSGAEAFVVTRYIRIKHECRAARCGDVAEVDHQDKTTVGSTKVERGTKSLLIHTYAI